MSTLFVSFLIYPSHFLLKICKVKNARFYAVTMLCQCLNVKLAIVVLWNCVFVASLQINRLSISELSGRYLNFILVSADPQFFFYANPKIKYFKFIHSFILFSLRQVSKYYVSFFFHLTGSDCT